MTTTTALAAVDRRTAMLGGIALATAAVVPATADAGTGELLALIDAKKAAYAAFLAAIDREQEAEHGYFARCKREILVPLSIGGAQSLYIKSDDYADHCREEIGKRYAEAEHRLDGLKHASPETAAKAREELRKAHAADLRGLRRIVREEQARRKDFGLEQAKAAWSDANDADRDALTAICGHRCRSFEELRIKAEFLLESTGGRFEELQPDEVEALLRSFLPAGV